MLSTPHVAPSGQHMPSGAPVHALPRSATVHTRRHVGVQTLASGLSQSSPGSSTPLPQTPSLIVSVVVQPDEGDREEDGGERGESGGDKES